MKLSGMNLIDRIDIAAATILRIALLSPNIAFLSRTV